MITVLVIDKKFLIFILKYLNIQVYIQSDYAAIMRRLFARTMWNVSRKIRFLFAFVVKDLRVNIASFVSTMCEYRSLHQHIILITNILLNVFKYSDRIKDDVKKF